jgi:SAM-dependent methyltransferase
MECSYESCRNTLKPENSATNFQKPALSVTFAINTGKICSGQKLLEMGAGNLRNALYVMRNINNIDYYVLEMREVVDRFTNNYTKFRRLGGHLFYSVPSKESFDIIICTFVFETICPSSKRLDILQSIVTILKSDGILVASFRGYPGVKGTKYELCPAREGLITPLRTFIKPFSLSELREFFGIVGLTNFEALQKYRTESPQNIHVAVRRG